MLFIVLPMLQLRIKITFEFLLNRQRNVNTIIYLKVLKKKLKNYTIKIKIIKTKTEIERE